MKQSETAEQKQFILAWKPASGSANAGTPAVDKLAQIEGCLLGGAVGDALGAAVEFMSIGEIRAQCGPGGITDFVPAYGRTGAITDDTQMTLWTAEGLLRGHCRETERGILHMPSIVHHAYLRWLRKSFAVSRSVPPLPGRWRSWLARPNTMKPQPA